MRSNRLAKRGYVLADQSEKPTAARRQTSEAPRRRELIGE